MKPNIIYTKLYDIRTFSWVGNHGTVEVSTLSCHYAQPFCQVYNDACDEGFAVRGKDRIIVFAVDSQRHSQGELISWELKSISEPGYSITVFND